MKKVWIFILLIILCSCTSNETKIDSYRFYAMDTMISIQFYNVDNSKEISDEVEKIYRKYDAVASDYQTGYQDVSVFDLNQNRKATVNDELLELIQFSLNMQKDTNGYYHPLIGKLTHAWKESLEKEELLADDAIEALLKEALETSVRIEDHTIELIGNGNMDLGGIAKGFATYKAQQYLKEIHCEHFLLNAGSSNIVLGSKLDEAFKVGLSQAYGKDYFLVLNLKNTCISTSSVKEQHYLINGKYYSHIINAKTGHPADYYETFSILGNHSGILDAYSTACFTMGIEEAKAFLQSKNLDFVCSKDNQLFYQTDGVKSCIN